MKLLLTIGAICMIISGIFIGAWTDGQQQRANFHSETAEHRNFRTKIAMYFAIPGLISLSIAALLYFY